MTPLGLDVASFDQFEEILQSVIADGQAIGFLFEDRQKSLQKSGLNHHPDSVMPLNKLLGQQITIFYIDPRHYETDCNSEESVKIFNREVIEKLGLNFSVDPPCLVLMRPDLNGSFVGMVYLQLSRKTVCMWYHAVSECIKNYVEDMNASSLDRQGVLKQASAMAKKNVAPLSLAALRVLLSYAMTKAIS